MAKVEVCMICSVIIGTCALSTIFAINEAGKREISKNIKESGAHRLFLDAEFCSNKRPKPPNEMLMLCYNDLLLIKNRVHEVKKISPLLISRPDTARIENRQEYPSENTSHVIGLQLTGVTDEFKNAMDVSLKEGRFINKTDILYKRKVCVLGGTIYQYLGGGKVLGKTLITKNPDAKFTIVGVLNKKMPLFTSLSMEKCIDLLVDRRGNKVCRKDHSLSLNWWMYLPMTTCYELPPTNLFPFFEELPIFSGKKETQKEIKSATFSPSSPFPMNTFIYMKMNIPEGEKSKIVEVEDEEYLKIFGNDAEKVFIPEKVKEPISKIRKVLREKYGDDKLFLVQNRWNLIAELEDQIEDCNSLLMITVIVTLLLSGIILSSTMLLSVYNQVSEIGIRRAFGARKKDIFLQFIREGVTVYSIGIIIGLCFGIITSYLLVNKILGWGFSIPIYGIILSSLFLFMVSILSSLYPAMRAAKIPPAQAVRYE